MYKTTSQGHVARNQEVKGVKGILRDAIHLI